MKNVLCVKMAVSAYRAGAQIYLTYYAKNLQNAWMRENRLMGLSEELFDRAVKGNSGGVNSPVRAYGAIGIAPRFIDRADGCHIS